MVSKIFNARKKYTKTSYTSSFGELKNSGNQVDKTIIIAGTLRTTIWKNSISISIRPAMIFAYTRETKRMLRTTEMRVLRVRRREWNEHVSRMDENRLVKIVRNGNPASKRQPGRLPMY